ncbi:arginine--tRNA ligase, chloroplastic/mitochondrial [Tanacetum coccineum]|uniref:Arginine--tRNA ligase, chloroplastic/mitochondrial n=1 Tax=Tanacetum coccineum TaxID=301880 RepID=A0ABQ4XU86_9ASTR
MESSSSKKPQPVSNKLKRMDGHQRPALKKKHSKEKKASARVGALKKTSSTSTIMACSTPSRAPSTSVPPEFEDKRMAPSTSSVTPSTSITMAPSTSITMALEKTPSTLSRIFARTTLMAPSTPIPPQFEWTRSISTPEEFSSFLKWARSAAKMADPDERRRLLVWAQSTSMLASAPGPEKHKRFLEFGHSSARIAAPYERKRLLKWAHSTSRIAAPDECETWSLQEEILKSFETALNRSYTDLKQEPMIYTYKGKPGLYECRNALWIWPKLRNSRALSLSQLDRGPRDVGEKIKEKFLADDMIEERPSINKLGFVTIKLSGKWIAKSIHTMLKDGIDTWAPKLPMERVIVDYPSLDEEIHEELFQQHAIRCTLMRILEYSKVDATIGHRIRDTDARTRSESRDISRAQEVLNRWFSKEERTDVVIKGKIPLGKRDFGNAYKDLFALWYGLHVQRADWIIYLTPVRLQEYIERCFTAAKRENWIPSDRHKSTRTSYAGYRACTTLPKDDLLDKARNCCVAVEKGEAAKLLGYTAEAVLNCAFRYTFLTNHRLAVWTLDIDEMLKEEGNTFVYILNTQAKIRRITNGSRDDINELKKLTDICLQQASELVLGKAEELILWKDEERMLGVHLLEFTEVRQLCNELLLLL